MIQTAACNNPLNPYIRVLIGAWLSLVERQVWDLKVASSNLVAPTSLPFQCDPIGFDFS